MRIILIGPQGSGKGTQGVRLAERLGVPHVATGDLLRAAKREETELGKKAQEYMERGDLVPDTIVLEMLKDRLARPDAAAGFILDGYPRNAAQCEALDEVLAEIGQAVDAVVSLHVPDEELVRRLSSRASCPTCGRPYTLTDGEPKTCAVDGTTLVQRTDDKPDAIRRRLDIFHAETEPIIEAYDKRGLVVRVDGVGEVPEVEDRIAKALTDR